jgi:hypothetical protein
MNIVSTFYLKKKKKAFTQNINFDYYKYNVISSLFTFVCIDCFQIHAMPNDMIFVRDTIAA